MPTPGEIVFSLFLFSYQFLIAMGAGLCAGKAFSAMFLRGFTLDRREEMILGFALAPVFVTIAAFAGVFRIPFAPEIIAYLLTMALLYMWKWTDMRPGRNIAWGFWAIAAVGLAALIVGKICYFGGGLNNGDDLRSVLLTGAFATNDLMPAFPFDFSAPVSYSHYLFEMSAFLYASVNGMGFPSVSVLVVNILAVFFFYQSLAIASERIFRKQARLKQFLVAIFLTFYGFDAFILTLADYHIEWWSPAQISQMASYAHWVYQYLFGGALLLLAILHADGFVRTRERGDWLLFCAFFLAAAGHATISAVWTAAGLLPIFALFIYKERIEAMRAFRSVLVTSVLLALLILGPQVWTFVARDVIFTFSGAHPWYPVMTLFGRAWNLWESNVLMILIEFGTFLTLGYLCALYAACSPKSQKSHPPFVFLSVLIVALLLRTFTTSDYFDWHTRGLLVSMIIAAFYAAECIAPLLASRNARVRVSTMIIGGAFLLPQAYTFSFEHRLRLHSCDLPSEQAHMINRTYPLGTIFYEESGSLYSDIAHAGRALLTPATPSLETYLNEKSFLEETMGRHSPFEPCEESRFGSTVPTGRYVLYEEATYKEVRCAADDDR